MTDSTKAPLAGGAVIIDDEGIDPRPLRIQSKVKLDGITDDKPAESIKAQIAKVEVDGKKLPVPKTFLATGKSGWIKGVVSADYVTISVSSAFSFYDQVGDYYVYLLSKAGPLEDVSLDGKTEGHKTLELFFK